MAWAWWSRHRFLDWATGKQGLDRRMAKSAWQFFFNAAQMEEVRFNEQAHCWELYLIIDIDDQYQ